MFDIVIAVYNAAHHARACISSVLAHASRPFHLYIVNDASDTYTSGELDALAAGAPDGSVTLLVNEHNLGYLKSVNRGITAGHQPYVLLLNSDTVVLPGFLEKLEAAFQVDKRIGVVNAVSNWANWTRICERIPPGYNIFELADQVAELAGNRITNIDNASGFFFGVRRELFDAIGLFDEAYGMGYWEEADFCMRARRTKWRVVVKEDLYVYHHGWGTFGEGGRNAHMLANKALFMERWGGDYNRAEKRQNRKKPLAYLAKVLDAPNAWARRQEKTAWPRVRKSEASRALAAVEEGVVQGTDDGFEAPPPAGNARGRIIYLVPGIALYGGIISVLQVVNQLVRQGYDANVAVAGTVDESVYRMFPTYFRGYEFPDESTLIGELPACDMVVATRWDTVYWARALQRLRPGLRLLYFVQDYEPDFYLPRDSDLARKAERTYGMVRHQIVKTRWLGQKLQPYGGEIHQIPLGLNLDFYHDYGRSRAEQVLALARPSSARRNFDMVKAVFSQIHRQRPYVQLALYGEGYQNEAFPFPVRSYGKLAQMHEVADALNDSTVLLDCSTFQGFGRPGLEAMACGTAAVLTDEGGITQYAKHMHNCLLINPNDCAGITNKVVHLMDNATLRKQLVENGRVTARAYSVEAEGRRTAALLESLGMRPRLDRKLSP